MSRHWRYFRYIIRHKYYVYREGRKVGLGHLRLILHDWHKFLPDERLPYARYFYGGPHQPWAEFSPALKWDWLSAYEFSLEGVQKRFDEAWLRHQHRAPHHWQHWVNPQDDGSTKVLEMSDADRREMLADWRAIGRAFGEEPPAVGWYEKNREKIQLHP